MDGQSDLPPEESLAAALERVFQNALADSATEALAKETAAAGEIGDEPVGADHRAGRPVVGPYRDFERKRNAAEADIAAGFSGKSLSARREWIQGHVMKHIGENETDKRGLPLSKSNIELLPSIWRIPDRVLTGDDPKSAILELDTFDGGTLRLAIKYGGGLEPLTLYKMKKPVERPS